MTAPIWEKVASVRAVPRWIWLSVIAIVFFELSVRGFSAWYPGSLVADDLRDYRAFLDGQYSSSPYQILMGTFFEKWRPVFSAVIGSMYAAFGLHVERYMLVNALVHTASGVLFFLIFQQITGRNWIASLSAGLAFILSRFALYQLVQVTGFIEALALFLFLASLCCLVHGFRAERRSRGLGWQLASVFLLALTILAHERYISILPAWCFCYATAPRLRWRERFWLIGAVILVAALYTATKAWILHMPFFVGTGGTHMDIDPARIARFAWSILASVFGFNEGPQYLVGMQWRELPPFYLTMAAVALATWTITIVAAIHATAKRPGGYRELWFPAFLLAIFVLISLPAILTIRVEQRWILEPFGLILLLLGWSIGRCKAVSMICAAPVVIFCIANGLVEYKLRDGFDRIFFTWSIALSKSAKTLLDGQDNPLIIEAGPDLCILLGDGDYFGLYQGRKRKIYCVAPGISPTPPPAGAKRLTFSIKGGFEPAPAIPNR